LPGAILAACWCSRLVQAARRLLLHTPTPSWCDEKLAPHIWLRRAKLSPVLNLSSEILLSYMAPRGDFRSTFASNPQVFEQVLVCAVPCSSRVCTPSLRPSRRRSASTLPSGCTSGLARTIHHALSPQQSRPPSPVFFLRLRPYPLGYFIQSVMCSGYSLPRFLHLLP